MVVVASRSPGVVLLLLAAALLLACTATGVAAATGSEFLFFLRPIRSDPFAFATPAGQPVVLTNAWYEV